MFTHRRYSSASLKFLVCELHFFQHENFFREFCIELENREIPSSANCAAFNLGSQHDCGEEKVVNATQRRRRRGRVRWHLIHVENILALTFTRRLG